MDNLQIIYGGEKLLLCTAILGSHTNTKYVLFIESK